MKHIISVAMLAAFVMGAQAQTLLTAEATQTETQKAWSVELRLETANEDYCAMQFDVELPAELEACAYTKGAPIENHLVVVNHDTAAPGNTPGSTVRERALVYSRGGDAFVFDGGPLLTIELRPSSGEALAEGDYTMTLSNIRLAHYDGAEDVLDDVVLTVKSGNDDAVRAVTLDADTDLCIYDVSGRFVRRGRIAGLPPGLYIVNGRKYNIAQ